MSDSSTNSSSSLSMFANRTVMAGLATGLDTEGLVKSATANLKASINTKKQNLQKLQYKQDAYRDVITKLQDFQSKYLDILSPSSIRAQSVMNKYNAVSTNDKVQVAASSSATPAEYNITASQKATKAEIKGTKISDGSVALDFSKAKADTNTVSVTLDGSTRSVTFEGGANAKENFLKALNKEFENVSSAKFAFRDGNDGKTGDLILQTESGDVVSHNFKIAYDESVGIKNDAYSNISKSARIGDIGFNTALKGNEFKFSINGVDFTFDRDSSLSHIMDTVNKSSAGVTMTFSTLSQSFTIASNGTGAGQEVNITQDKGNLINSLFNITGGVGGAVNTGNCTSKPFVNRDVDTVNYTITSDRQKMNGFEAGSKMTLTIDGKEVKMDLSDLTKKQESKQITVKDSEGNDVKYYAKVFNKEANGSGRELYTYTTTDENGMTTHYAAKNNDDTVSDVFTIVEEKDGTVTGHKGSQTFEGDDLENIADGTDFYGIDTDEDTNKTFVKYTPEQYLEAFTDAFAKAAKAAGVDTDAVKFEMDSENKLTIKPKNNTIPVKVNDPVPFGFNPQDASNYTETKKEFGEKISDTPLKFRDGNGKIITIGDETNGVTLSDLLTMKDESDGNKNYFSYDFNDWTVSLAAGKSLEGVDENTVNFLNENFGLSLSARGTNARITIDGVVLENAESTFTVDGTTITMDKVEDFTEADSDKAITITTSKDNSAIKETIKNFINDYNTLIKDLYTQIKTARPKDGKSYYDPLTEEQEDEMTDKEIEKWNEKAKEGWLYNDASVNKLINSIRSAVGSSFNGMSLADLGIKLKAGAYTDPTYEIDDGKLEAAINRWGDDITRFFTDSDKGLAAKLNKAIDDAISTKATDGKGNKKSYGYLTMVAGVKDTVSATKNQLYVQMNSIQKYIDKLTERYEKQQESLWKKFTSLETYVQKMNAQMSYFQQY